MVCNNEVKGNFLQTIIEAKENANLIIIDEKKWTSYNDLKKAYLKSIDAFISKKVKSKHRKEIKTLIELVIGAIDDRSQYECNQYYISGLKDCIELYTSLFGKEISGR